MAIARKVIILDCKDTSPLMIFGAAAVVLAMSIGYWLVNKYTGDSVRICSIPDDEDQSEAISRQLFSGGFMKNNFKTKWLGPAILALVIFTFLGTSGPAAAKMTVGWVERVRLEPSGFLLKAKMDTGAKTASLHASDIELVERGDQTEVAFSIVDDQGRTTRLQLPLVRMVRVKRHRTKSHERPVVMMTICLGGVKKAAQVNLIDRGRFKYKLLVGRRFMAGVFLVDPEVTFTTKPVCP